MNAPELSGATRALDALLAVVRGEPSPVLDAVVWRAVPALARTHRMQGLLHRAMTADAWPAPDAVRRQVADDALVVAEQSLQRIAALRVIADAAAERGIPMMPYKGPLLSLVAYGDVGLRPAADLDVLVPRARAAEAAAMLAACGYRPGSAFAEPLHTRLHAHLGATPWRGESGAVDLHWRLCEHGLPWTMHADALMTRSEMVTVSGRAFPVPAADDLLLMLAWHGARHAWEEMEWLAAVAALVRAHPPDWAALVARGAVHGGARAVLLMQSLLAEWLGVGSPPREQAWLRDARALLGAQYVRGTTLFAHDRAQYRRFLLALLERPLDRAALTLAQVLLPTARDGDWVALPATLWPLYVPLRLLRLTLHAAGFARTREAVRA